MSFVVTMRTVAVTLLLSWAAFATSVETSSNTPNNVDHIDHIDQNSIILTSADNVTFVHARHRASLVHEIRGPVHDHTTLKEPHNRSMACISHYGNPYSASCCSDENKISIYGQSGRICSPKCNGSGGTSSSCPHDVPAGVKAIPICALYSSTHDYCGLFCFNDSECGSSGFCGNSGLCTYTYTNR